MDTRKYEAFMKAAELGSIKKAAEALGYTQAGLSYILRTLEEELNTLLFARDYGKLILTSAGRELLPIVHSICNDERRLQRKISELAKLESGSITVGVFTSIAIHWLPSLMGDFLKEYPGVRFEVEWYEETYEADEMISKGEIDCAFSVLPDVNSAFDKIFLVKDPMVIILAEDHPLAREPFFLSKSMEEEPYISGGNHSEMNDLLFYNGVKPEPRMTLGNDFAVMSMVSQGFGYSIFPALMMKNLPFPLIVKEPEISFSREVGLALRSYAEAPCVVKAFVDFTKKWIADQND